MDKDSIYNLDLHDSVQTDYYCITRVPGGWLYCFISENGAVAQSFVPLNNEFRKPIKLV